MSNDIQSYIQQLTSKINAYEKEIVNLKCELNQLESTIHNQNSKQKYTYSHLNYNKNNCFPDNKKNTELEDENSKLKSLISCQDNQIKNLNEKVNELEMLLQNKESEIKDMMNNQQREKENKLDFPNEKTNQNTRIEPQYNNNNNNISNNNTNNYCNNCNKLNEMLNEVNKEFENQKIYLSNEIENRDNKINELKKNLDIQLKNFENELEKKNCELEQLNKKNESNCKILQDLFLFFQRNLNLFNNSKIINCDGTNIKYDNDDISQNEKYSSFILKTFNNFICKILKDNKEMFELLIEYKNTIAQNEEEIEKLSNQNNCLKMQVCDLVNQLTINNENNNNINTNLNSQENIYNQNTNHSTFPYNFNSPMKQLKVKINELENTIRNQNYDN